MGYEIVELIKKSSKSEADSIENKLLRSWSYTHLHTSPPPHQHKMPSRYFEGNTLTEHHSNIEDFYHHIYFETVDTVANCIVEYFHQKDYTMYANCEQVLLKGTLGELVSQNVDQLCEFYTEFDSEPYVFSYHLY